MIYTLVKIYYSSNIPLNVKHMPIDKKSTLRHPPPHHPLHSGELPKQIDFSRINANLSVVHVIHVAPFKAGGPTYKFFFSYIEQIFRAKTALKYSFEFCIFFIFFWCDDKMHNLLLCVCIQFMD